MSKWTDFEAFEILGHEFRIKYCSPSIWSEGGMGRVNVMDQTILINEDLKEQTKQSTLRHEIIHAISDMLELGLTEAQVAGLAIGLQTITPKKPQTNGETQ